LNQSNGRRLAATRCAAASSASVPPSWLTALFRPP
jgi:hypothetical protein